MAIDIVDIFAGPGGLGEGFASLKDENGNRVFQIICSIEEKVAECETLRMRSFCRKLTDKGHFDAYAEYLSNPTKENRNHIIEEYPEEWLSAKSEVLEKKINQCSQVEMVKDILNKRHDNSKLVLLGGPPCQAYSLAGRARNTNRIKNNDEQWQKDKRRTLYKRYLYFIRKLMPDAFVMENVKGILSATYKDEVVFNAVHNDLKSLGYTLYSLVSSKHPKELEASDFIIQCENYGIPQRRHRVIILGVSKSFKNVPGTLQFCGKQHTVEECIGDLPRLRSSFSRREKNYSDEADSWAGFVAAILAQYASGDENSSFDLPKNTGCEWMECESNKGPLRKWYKVQKMKGVPNHQSKSHIAKDIERYIFCALKAKRDGEPPKIDEFPKSLLPDHQNVSLLKGAEKIKRSDVVFADRFRVQLRDNPATTITSHISKDGHYYIHYDPSQARSLTVREAARLQTFPDDYRFEGSKTEQYHQVGNAVPPYLARQIAEVVYKLLFEK